MLWQEELLREQQQRRDMHLWRTRHELTSMQSAEVTRNGTPFLNFCSNDYLGLASHPKLAEASAAAAKKWGTGSGASHSVCGHQSPHHLLEEELAAFLGTESALLFSTGYMANLAIPKAFLGRGDLLLQDKLNHASIIDSAALCPAEFKRYPHNDLSKASERLKASTARRKMLTTDSVFSMDGDLAPIKELHSLCQEQEAMLVIDDAHSLGVLGETGAGSIEHFNLRDKSNFLIMGTLGKAFGSFGAFVAGDAVYIDYLKQHARTYIYTTALPATVVEASRAALSIVKEEPWRREHLHKLIKYFRESASQFGLTLMPSQTAIQPILFGADSSALNASAHLENSGIWVPAIRPPTVPKGTARLRICLSSNHTFNHIDQLIKSLSLFDFDIDYEDVNHVQA